MAPELSSIERAKQLLARGESDTACMLLESAADAGDKAAALALGKSFLGGREFGRDLERSRRYFQHAAELGDLSARSAFIALLANGTGGKADWQGAVELLRRHASSDADYARQVALIERMAVDEQGLPQGAAPASEQWEAPNASIFRNFLTADECDYLIEAAGRLLRPSTVVDPQSGQLVRDPIRTSDYAAFPLALETPAVRAINLRIAAASQTQVTQGEPLQVLRYAPGQEYKPHFDALPHPGNQRTFTFLAYLNEEFEGGATHFPKAGRTFRGNKGDALLFANVTDEGMVDADALHAGQPVTKGVKYLASRWIRAHQIDLTL